MEKNGKIKIILVGRKEIGKISIISIIRVTIIHLILNNFNSKDSSILILPLIIIPIRIINSFTIPILKATTARDILFRPILWWNFGGIRTKIETFLQKTILLKKKKNQVMDLNQNNQRKKSIRNGLKNHHHRMKMTQIPMTNKMW